MEVQKVLDSEGLEEEDHVGQIGPLDLRHGGHQHLGPVRCLRVHPVALPAQCGIQYRVIARQNEKYIGR